MRNTLQSSIRLMRSRSFVPLAIVTGCILWAYWSTLGQIASRWTHDPRYSHGYFVLLFAGFLLWRRRQLASVGRPSWWGAIFLLAATLLRGGGVLFYNDWLDAVSLLPLLVAAVLLLGGWPMLRWSWPAILYLIFMIPLPYSVERALTGPLQRIATLIANYSLQTLGFSAFAEGNVIHVNEAHIGVEEACSGLGMFLLFFALATGVAILSRRPLVDRILIVISAVPIAVLANVIRITTTAFVYVLVGSRGADFVFHDLAGWFMMPLALGMMWVELWLLRRLLIEQQTRRLAPIGLIMPPSSISGPRSGRRVRR